MRASGIRPSKEDRKDMMIERVKKEKETNTKMKEILTEEQFIKFLALKKEQKEKRMQNRNRTNK